MYKSAVLGGYIVVALVSQFSSNFAMAEDCKPSDFTFSELKQINFSDDIAIAGYSLVDASHSDNEDHSLAGGAAISGIPASASYADNKAVADHVLEKSGFNYDRKTVLQSVQTALSSAGVHMYDTCMGANSIDVSISPAAYTKASKFFLTVSWKPKKQGELTALSSISVIDGSIAGKSELSKKVRYNAAQRYMITKTDKPLQISIIIDGESYPDIVIPPYVPLVKFVAHQRRGTAEVPRTTPNDYCTGEANITSFESEHIAKSCTLTVIQTDGGVLLKSTASVEGELSRGGNAHVLPDANPFEVKAEFSTFAPGKKSGNFSVQHGILTVWEATPVDTK